MAGQRIQATFDAERLVRRADFQELLSRSTLRRAGPIGLLEARMLAAELPANARVKVAGKVFSILHGLNPAEREILILLEKPRAAPELVVMAAGLGLQPECCLDSGYIVGQAQAGSCEC